MVPRIQGVQMSKKNDLIGLQGGRKIARKLSLFFASLSLYQAPLSFQCNVPSLSMQTFDQKKGVLALSCASFSPK